MAGYASLGELSINALLMLHMAISDGRCKNNFTNRNQLLSVYLTRKIKANALTKYAKDQVNHLLRELKSSRAKHPKTPALHVNLYAYLLKFNITEQEHKQRYDPMAQSDLGRLSDAVSVLRQRGFRASIISELAKPASAKLDQIIILRQHLEEAFDDNGVLNLPCSLCVVGDYQPVVDVLHSYRLPVYAYQIAKNNGKCQSHLQLHPTPPQSIPLLQPSRMAR